MRSESRSEYRGSAREDLRDDMSSPGREFTLSTGTVLGLFFGLALLCAVFFGFGYSMGRKSGPCGATGRGCGKLRDAGRERNRDREREQAICRFDCDPDHPRLPVAGPYRYGDPERGGTGV